MYEDAQNAGNRLAEVRSRIAAACREAERPLESVTLLAVSKAQPISKIRALYHSGQRVFGENYANEAISKIQALSNPDLEWHFIGPLQSNKTRAISGHFDWVQSVDRLKIVHRLADHRPAGHAPLNVLIQVNIDDETAKSGCAPEAVFELAGSVAERPELALRGLMAIPAPRNERADQAVAFEKLRDLFERLQARFPDCDTLSAGMSADLEAAIAAGSTMIRVGTALFGPRRNERSEQVP